MEDQLAPMNSNVEGGIAVMDEGDLVTMIRVEDAESYVGARCTARSMATKLGQSTAANKDRLSAITDEIVISAMENGARRCTDRGRQLPPIVITEDDLIMFLDGARTQADLTAMSRQQRVRRE